MAIRDQIIYSQREAHRNLWNMLMSLGLDEKHIIELGEKQGITIEDIQMKTPLGLPNVAHSPKSEYYERHTPSHNSTTNGQSGTLSPCFFPQDRELSSRTFSMENRELSPPFFREEHHSSYYYISHGSATPSANQEWCAKQPTSSYFGAVHQQSHSLISPYDESGVSTSSFKSNFRQQQQQQQQQVFKILFHIQSIVANDY